MADILTQLQTCLDQLATQFYATVAYLSTYHDSSPADLPPEHIVNDIPGGSNTIMPRLMKIPRNQPTAAPMPVIIGNTNNNPNLTTSDQSQSQIQTQTGTSQQQQPQQSGTAGDLVGTGMTAPDSPRTFAARQRELARDLIIKEQQIEYLIARLPGIDSSEAEQEARIRELERELRGVEAERDTKARELRHLLRKLEGVMGAVQSGIFGHRD